MLFKTHAMMFCLLRSHVPNFALVLWLPVLGFSACGGKDEEGEDEQCPGNPNAEGDEREGGCETDIVCASKDDCTQADRDPCREYFCHRASATCRYFLLDRDKDGFLPPGCGGRDCNDDSEAIRPGAPEQCNGQSDDCDEEVDEEIAAVPCLGKVEICGVQTCAGGEWSECAGGTGPTEEVCDGVDNDCNGWVDEGPRLPPTEWCDPIGQTGCNPGETCYLVVTSGQRIYNCWCSAGKGRVGDSCDKNGNGDCAPGFYCRNRHECAAVCTRDDDCGELDCVIWPEDAEFGVCL